MSDCEQQPGRSACRSWFLETSVALMWHKIVLLCNVCIQSKNIGKIFCVAEFLCLLVDTYNRANMHKLASNVYVFVATYGFVGEPSIARGFVTTPIDSLGARAACVYSSVSELQYTRSRPGRARHIHIRMTPILGSKTKKVAYLLSKQCGITLSLF